MTRSASASILVIIVATLVAITACTATPAAAPTVDLSHIGTRTKTSGCVIQGKLPDPACTPGAVLSNATKEQICRPGYSSSVRDVTEEEKNQVYAEYGIRTHTAGQYEVDHLISLELGGSNDIANLWPEAAEPRPGFHEKDQVENKLHDAVCQGAMTLSQAQAGIANNWLAFYGGVVPPGSIQARATAAPVSPGQASATASGHRFVASRNARTYYYCDSDPAWHSLSSADLVWSDDPATFQAKGLELHSPC